MNGSRPEGRITLNNEGRLVVNRPADLTDEQWSALTRRMAQAAHATTPTRITVDTARVRVLESLLADQPGRVASWRWTSQASNARDRAADAATALRTMATTDVAVQAAANHDETLTSAGFARTLRDFQRGAVARLVSAEGGANFSVPGSGKTTVAYATYAVLREQGVVNRLVVVCPPAAFEAWDEEAVACFADGRAPDVAIRPERIDGIADVTVLNYEHLTDARVLSALTSLCERHDVLVVFDEAHRAKAGDRSQRGAAALRLARAAKRSAVLTGTPMPNRTSDLAAVFDLVWPGHGQRAVPGGDLDQVRERLFVRATKADLGLPPMHLTVERVALDPAHRDLYDAMTSKVVAWADSPEATAAEAGSALMRLIAAATNPAAVFAPDLPFGLRLDPAMPGLAQSVSDPTAALRPAKIIRAAQIVADNAARGRKTLVWSSFVGNIRALSEALAHHQPAVITGSVPVDDEGAPRDRRRELARFRTDPDCKVLIATPQTLGEGVSLHRVCTDQVHVDRGFAAGTWLQSIDRTHRLGLPADATATCVVLQAVGTVDERVAQVLDAKVAAMAAALDDESLRPVADPAIVPDDPVAAILGDIDAIRELVALTDGVAGSGNTGAGSGLPA